MLKDIRTSKNILEVNGTSNTISMHSYIHEQLLSTTNDYQITEFSSGAGTIDLNQNFLQDKQEILFSLAAVFHIQNHEKIQDNF